MSVDEEEKPGILLIEDGDDRSIYYCDSWGRYWDEITNKKLSEKLVTAARLDEIRGLYQYGVISVSAGRRHERPHKSEIVGHEQRR